MVAMQNYDPQNSVGFLLNDVARLMRRDFDARVESLGLTQSQWRAIAHIARLEGCNQVTLAEQLEIKPITLTRLIDRLSESGWVVRQPDPRDRRAIQLHLTDKSRPLITMMQEKALQTRAEALKGLSENECTALTRTLQIMKANLSK